MYRIVCYQGCIGVLSRDGYPCVIQANWKVEAYVDHFVRKMKECTQ